MKGIFELAGNFRGSVFNEDNEFDNFGEKIKTSYRADKHGRFCEQLGTIKLKCPGPLAACFRSTELLCKVGDGSHTK
jgi:hypothetical protein